MRMERTSTDEPIAYINNSVVHIKRENAHKGTLLVNAVEEACNNLHLPVTFRNAVNGRGVDIGTKFSDGYSIGWEVKNTTEHFAMSYFWCEQNVLSRYLYDEVERNHYSVRGLVITQYSPRSNQVCRAMRSVVLVQTGIQVVDDRTYNRAVRTLMHQLKRLTILHSALEPESNAIEPATEEPVTDECPYSCIDEAELDMLLPIYSDLFSD